MPGDRQIAIGGFRGQLLKRANIALRPTVNQAKDTGQVTLDIIMAIKMYRAPFAMVTNSRKDQTGSRSTPATTVMGSPMNGTQLSRSEKRPYFRYCRSAVSSLSVLMGNHGLSR